MSNKDRGPSFAKAPATGNTPVVESAISLSDRHPAWRFRRIDEAGPFGWTSVDDAAFRELLRTKLVEFESMTWEKIKGKHHHYLSVESLSKDARKRLEELKLDDFRESIFSFSLAGKPRLVGYVVGNVFHVLWWDPEHLVCPSHKKHT